MASDAAIAVPDAAAPEAGSVPGTEPAAVVPDPEAAASTTTRRRSTRARTAKKAVAAPAAAVEGNDSTEAAGESAAEGETPAPVKRARAPRKRTSKRAAAAVAPEAGESVDGGAVAAADGPTSTESTDPAASTAADSTVTGSDAVAGAGDAAAADTAQALASVAGTEQAPAAPESDGGLFAEPAPAKKTTRRRSTRKASAPATRVAATEPDEAATSDVSSSPAVSDAKADSKADAPAEAKVEAKAENATAESTPATDSGAPSASATTASSADARPTTAPASSQTPVTTPSVAEAPRTRPRTRVRSAAERAAEAAAEEAAQAARDQAAAAQRGDAPEAGRSYTAAAQADEATEAPARPAIMPLFQAPEPAAQRPRRAASRPAGPPKPVIEEAQDAAATPAEDIDEDETVAAEDVAEEATGLLEGPAEDAAETEDAGEEEDAEQDAEEGSEDGEEEESNAPRRRRRRGGRGRRGRSRGDSAEQSDAPAAAAEEGAEEAEPAAEDSEGGEDEDGEESSESTGSRRRRRRRRKGSGSTDGEVTVDEGTTVVTKVREGREGRRSGGTSSDDVTSVRGSTRLEAKKQRRREGREAGRRRTILSEAEFLARRESVERKMVVREREGRTQIGVLEDGVLVEHYVARKTQTSTVGNVYLGRVQNVLPSMEAAFVDIGKGRNAVLYAGEVNWDAAGLEGQPRRIEHALKAGDSVLVQVTKDPIGHKGARLTSQISMPGRYLVYVPDGSMTGISRKLPDTERSRLKKILREVVPDNAGVIVRTAAEGASDEELERDVQRLQAQWEDISAKVGSVNAPAMLYGEPDLAIKVVRDVFNEDFSKLIISGDEAWGTLHGYISHVAPDLVSRLQHWQEDKDVFAKYRIDEQLAKGLDRKVWLPSGGSLVIDRTEAMTVIDVNTGKFTGAGGNLEETVTKNNLEAAEEVVHQLRLRDIGGIIVVDFIDMVLESNRDLVLRRLLECLGRDRTRHQVAEVTSLGLVQMTRKRVGQGLLEVFSETCEHCGGRGLVMHDEPVEKKQQENGNGGGGGGRKGRNNHHH
nr:ribonuclease E/G [Kineosporia babensis]